MPVLEERVATSTDTTDDHLAWQTAFWCLAAVALNTMSQPTGRILRLSSSHSFYLKSSPVICALNIIFTLVDVVKQTYSRRSILDAVLLWEAHPFGEPSQRSQHEIDSLRKGTVIRLILFVLGALLPAIKLYSCRGVPFTQAVCTIDLVCFILDETLNGLAWLASRPTCSAGPPYSVNDDLDNVARVLMTLDAGTMCSLLLFAALSTGHGTSQFLVCASGFTPVINAGIFHIRRVSHFPRFHTWMSYLSWWHLRRPHHSSLPRY